MNWHKTNLALIVILLIIDVMVGTALLFERKSALYLPDDMLSEARENLLVKGIDTNDSVDTRVLSSSVYLYETENAYAEIMRDTAAETHTSLLATLAVLTEKSDTYIAENINYFDLPNGLSLSLGSDGETLAAATVSGKCRFEFFDSDFSENPFSSLSIEAFDGTAKTRYVKKEIDEFFTRVYGESVGFRLLGESEKDDLLLAACRLTVEKCDLADTVLYFAFRDKKIVGVCGDLLFSPPKAAYNAEILDGISILYHLDSEASAEEPITILSETPVYTFLPYDSLKYYLIPTWEIRYEKADGTVETKRLNALTGKEARENDA